MVIYQKICKERLERVTKRPFFSRQLLALPAARPVKPVWWR